jgi:hypothetical protein
MAASLANEQAANARLREEAGIVSVISLLAGTVLGFLFKGMCAAGSAPGAQAAAVTCANCGFVGVL